MVNRQQKGNTYRTPQEIQNLSYDEQYAIETTAAMGYRIDLDAFVPLSINSDGSLKTSTPSLIVKAYDYLSYTNTNATTDTYVYKTGGAAGTTTATVTIVYTDSTKAVISTVTRT